MTQLLKRLHPEITAYKDRRFNGGDEDWERALKQSTTVYVGNLSFFTREEQIYEVFSKAGHISKVIMGLDRERKTPCGFCFVIYYTRSDSEKCVRYLNGTILDERPIRVDHDWGFVDGRQWGRGKSGGQVRDEFRVDFDEGRGGFGKLAQKEIDEQYASLSDDKAADGGGGGMLVMDKSDRDPKRRRTDHHMTQDGYQSRRSSGAAPPPPPPPPPSKERDEPENPRFKERDEDDD